MMNDMQSLQDPNDVSVVRGKSRPVFTYVIPPKLHRYGIKTVGLIELTANEELMATRRSAMSPMALAAELAKESLRKVDSKSVSTTDGTADFAFNTMHPKIRTLVMSAYNLLHNPDGDDTKGFLDSQEMSVG